MTDKRRIDMWIPRELHIEAKHTADKHDKTFTEFVIEAIEEKIRREEER